MKLSLCNVVLVAVLALGVAEARAASLSTDFDAGFPAGWVSVNQSDAPQQNNWTALLSYGGITADHGGAGRFAGANDLSIDGEGTVDNWLLTPQLSFTAGDVVTFWTRTRGAHGEGLEVRLSSAGSSTNTGVDDGNFLADEPNPATAGDPKFPHYRQEIQANFGDFSTLLLAINTLDGTHDADWPNFGGTAYDLYPTAWTLETITIPSTVSGRLGFRYNVFDGGFGANSLIVAVDDVNIAPAPEPASLALLGLGGLLMFRRRSR